MSDKGKESNHAITRREFLRRGLAVSGATILTGCAPIRLPTETPRQSPRPAPTEIVRAQEDYKKKTVAEIRALPDSTIKRALELKVVPLLETPTPFKVNMSGVDIWFNKVTVQEVIVRGNKTGVDATYNGRKSISDIKYHPVATVNTRIPIVGILRPSEIAQFAPESKLPDGTITADFLIEPDGFIDKAFTPDISVTVTWDGRPDTAQYLQPLITYGYIKEACSFLLDILKMEATIEKMKQFVLQTNVDARDQNGNIESITVLPEALTLLDSRKGRSLALKDIAGYLVAAKVLANTTTHQKMVESGAIDSSFLPLIANANLGTTERDILFKSYEWTLNTPEALKLPHRGDINTIS